MTLSGGEVLGKATQVLRNAVLRMWPNSFQRIMVYCEDGILFSQKLTL
jgi:hypothetical protein